jgi:hypothetical protein
VRRSQLVGLVAISRVLIGVALGLAPRRLLPLLVPGEPQEDTVTAFRTVAVRDFVLGLGTLATRHRPEALRGWVAASALVDAADAATFASARSLRPAARLAGAAVGACAALLQAGELRVLGR